jgi:DnaD/phage-associated family protein
MRLHNRQIKATFWTDPDLLQWVREKRLFYMGLSQLADDSGCLEDSPFAFKISLFPSPVDADITVDSLAQWRDEFIAQGKIMPYDANGKPYLFMVNFHKHQTLDKPTPPSKASIPLPPWVVWVKGDTRNKSYYQVLDLSETCSGQIPDTEEACSSRTGTGTITRTRTTTTPISPPPENNPDDFNPAELENSRREVFSSFEQEFGRTLSPTEYQEIIAWLDGAIEGIPPFSPELILYALKQAALNAKRNTGYVRGILLNWHHNGVKSVQDAEERERQFQLQKQKASAIDRNKRASPTAKCETTGQDYELYVPPG